MSVAVVTGAAGFIGSHLAEALARRGHVVVASDHMTSDDRWRNLDAAGIAHFVKPDRLADTLLSGRFGDIAAVFHQGACSDTTERDAAFVFERNYHSSVELLDVAQRLSVPFVYASSASVYGNSFRIGSMEREEAPLNTYAYSKLLFDRYIRQRFAEERTAGIVGLRYFNVYGEREGHKGRMASVVHHFWGQARADGEVRLFEGTGEYGDGEQRRDFVYVDDVVAANLHFGLDAPTFAICDVGTGEPRAFNDIARVVQERTGCRITYIPFPADLVGRYQHWTCADSATLAAAGFPAGHRFTPLETGVGNVLSWLEARNAR
jgi:ADP-L-glycero-D-manno-heptose 6-epimerase